MSAAVDHDTLKATLKEAVLELLRERPTEVRCLIEEMIEDLGLVHAMEEGKETGFVSRERVEATLRGEV